MKVYIVGHKGWIGQMYIKLFEEQNIEYLYSDKGGSFMATIEKLAELTNRKVSEISNAFASAGLTADAFTPPSTGGGSANIEPPPSLGDLAGAENNNTGGNTGGSGTVQQPVKIYTTLNIAGERFETVTQDALINLQKQGKKILI